MWPPGASDEQRLRQVLGAMRAVPAFTVNERVTSGPGSVVAPTTVRISGQRFIATEPYAAGNVPHVRFLAVGPTRRRAPTLTLYLPGSQILVRLELDAHNRIARERLVSPGHEITRTLSYP